MAIYEKDLLLDASSNSPLKMSDVTSKYGQPEEIVNGSNFYGYGVSTYIYADKGFAVIGNANADKVYELQTFLPMSIDQYKSQYGQDLNSNYSQPDKEGISADQENLLNFKSHLPYAGNSFIIVYNKDTDITTVVIKQNNKDVGTKNFQSYLETFGITDSSQINNLTIEYK